MSDEPEHHDARPALAPFDIETLDRDPSSICALTPDLRVSYVNRAWEDFSRDNGGSWGQGRWKVGVPLLLAVPPVLRTFYDELFERAKETRSPLEHTYECSSATVFRKFRMQVFPCEEGLVVAHSLSREAPHRRVSTPSIEALYRGKDGLILQCSHCRRVKRAEEGSTHWDWVPDYAAHMAPRTSHGLCPLCERYYFPP